MKRTYVLDSYRSRTLSEFFKDLVNVIVCRQETEIEDEIDHGSEGRLSHQKQEVPDVVSDVVDIFQRRFDEATIEEECGKLLEVEEEARYDVENVD